jgi:glyoxylase-like metal-dependent hydrolase (beta-lactamase superfamily II)
MLHGPLRVGDVEVVAVCEGVAALPLAAECPGVEVDWPAARAEHPWAFTAPDRWPWHVHVFVLRTRSGVVLVDTGIGRLPPPSDTWTERYDGAAGLAAVGVEPQDVAHVVLTHLHGDHAGGTVTVEGFPRFPNARYDVHPWDWVDFATDPDPDDRGNRLAMQALAEAGQLHLDPEDHVVAAGLRVVHTPGHTRGHRSVVLEEPAGAVLLTGDLLHLPVQVGSPQAASSHDRDPAAGAASRCALLAEAAERGWLLAVPHFARPFGRLDRVTGGMRWVAA